MLAMTTTRRPRTWRLTSPTVHEVARPERVEQAAVFTWAANACRQWPELRLLFAVPNAAKRTAVNARLMLATGLKAGVPDALLPIARDGCIGLAIEMKTKGNKPTDLQQAWLTALAEQGWRCKVCYSATDAIEVLRAYMSARRTEVR